MRPAIIMASALALLAGCAPTQPPCPLSGQTRMLMIGLYFGRDIPGRDPVTDAEWRDFARGEMTPRFPDGFTVFDARGQWLNPATGQIGAEATKFVQLAAPAGARTASRVQAIVKAYRARFRQDAVGVTSALVCAVF